MVQQVQWAVYDNLISHFNMKIEKQKLETKLKEKLGRDASLNEITNSETDVNLVVEILADEIETLKAKVVILEKRKNVV